MCVVYVFWSRVLQVQVPAAAMEDDIDCQQPSVSLRTAQLLLSCLHAWGQDKDLDELCRRKLGLLTPKRPLVFGLMSRTGYMALSLPGWSVNIKNRSYVVYL